MILSDSIIGVDKSQKYVAITDFLREDGSYKLAPYLEDAYKNQVANGFQKEFKETDQRISLLFNTVEARSLKIFPIPEDDNNTWISPIEYREQYEDKVNDTIYGKFVENSFGFYLSELYKAKQTGDFTTANKLLESFKKNQEKLGSEVMISKDRIRAEILYNKYDIFKKLFSWYMYAGVLLFVFIIIQIFKSYNKGLNLCIKILVGIIVGLFMLHTLGLIVRWYISGHAPWSDAYESIIYVAWATMLFGLMLAHRRKDSTKKKTFGSILTSVVIPFHGVFLSKSSDITVAATAFVTSMLLMVAHLSWMDPAIANLATRS